ncbi:LysE family translocator [Jannaschia seohaensis]|uniref:Threonine/homoserine/homoserine lactone efflux protein n=1 Tax=Jannaschia seohaensis TaxID=475081 RepID=A0A2Y9AI85_9RHOB|nr:LysE family translocator [Jannaschia seohaensis]PWJ20190.1 threonine/homoserine/homoserine lactone efflux protein [Jannaschia seohaensis]SSA44174.1 Threonine/homoserine/homoserine lactone efflux protein [Jannaschia seohaensis]
MVENPNLFAALVTFAVIASVTPGPNNFMVMASSAAFGWRRTVPHVAGIAGGFAIMIGSVVLGLGAVLDAYPHVVTAVRIAGAGWLFWLAWQMGRSAFGPTADAEADPRDQKASRPLNIFEAALFQWVNPKAWTMALGASAAYSGVASEPVMRAAVMAMTFLVVAPFCLSLWALAGRGLSALITQGASARWMSLLMAALVAFSAASVLIGP